MRVHVTPEGETQLAARKRWWRENRPKAPDLFDEELAQAMDQVAQAPESFPIFAERRGHTIRRCLLQKTRCHLYFEIRAAAGDVWVLAAAGGQRRRPPRIALRDLP